jgi:hypothetical protein
MGNCHRSQDLEEEEPKAKVTVVKEIKVLTFSGPDAFKTNGEVHLATFSDPAYFNSLNNSLANRSETSYNNIQQR